MAVAVRARRIGILAAVAGFAMVGIEPAHAAPTAGDGEVALRVTPVSSLFDSPLKISVRGLKPTESATLRVTSTDVNGIAWASEASFRASDAGVINPARNAPISGSYSGVQPMGLIDFMSPGPSSTRTIYAWGSKPQSFTFRATSEGRRAAAVTIDRSASKSDVRRRQVTLDKTGFRGELWQPAAGTAKKPAVLVIGGSAGGLRDQLVSGLLASHGYPTLNIAYFNTGRLPPTLSNIPLEYFARALEWFGKQANVDPGHIYVLGTSRGSEAALLLGVHFPELVAGVIASVPGNVALCSPDCEGPAWALNGQALPFTRQFNNPAPTDEPAAVIPVEQIRGPVLLLCGGADEIWNSCAYANAIQDRLAAHKVKRPPTLLAYPDAGHGVGALFPFQPGNGTTRNAPFPVAAGRTVNPAGATPEANALALAEAWPRVLNFLRKS